MICVATVAHAEHIDPIAVIMEANAPITNAEPEFGRVNASQSLDIAGAGCGEAVNCSGDSQCYGAVERGQIGLGLCGNRHTLDHEGSW
jgi:hypothetical protein